MAELFSLGHREGSMLLWVMMEPSLHNSDPTDGIRSQDEARGRRPSTVRSGSGPIHLSDEIATVLWCNDSGLLFAHSFWDQKGINQKRKGSEAIGHLTFLFGPSFGCICECRQRSKHPDSLVMRPDPKLLSCSLLFTRRSQAELLASAQLDSIKACVA